MDEFYKGQKVHCKRNGDGVDPQKSERQNIFNLGYRAIFGGGHHESYTRDGKILIGTRETHLTPRGEEEVMSKDFYVGQKVWCVLFGEGVVAQSTHDMYPVKVKFKTGDVRTYTREGYMYINCRNQSLFHRPVKIVQDESAAKPSINWSHVKDKYKWLAVNANGGADVFENEPKVDAVAAYWYNPKGGCNKVNGLASYEPGTCDWCDSLVKRPELVQEI